MAHEVGGFGSRWLMWLGMCALMMAPVVLPWLRAVARLARAEHGGGRVPPVSGFALGYAVAWAAFSAAAAGVQGLVAAHALPGPWIAHAPVLAGSALVLAGGFQFTGLKDACLSHCRSPLGYLLAHWRPGLAGAWSLGLRHGAFCLGCCWALMALALVTGAMEPLAMGLLAALMLGETLAPGGLRLVRPIGLALVLAGLALVARSVFVPTPG